MNAEKAVKAACAIALVQAGMLAAGASTSAPGLGLPASAPGNLWNTWTSAPSVPGDPFSDAGARIQFPALETPIGGITFSAAAGSSSSGHALSIAKLENPEFSDLENLAGRHVQLVSSLFGDRLTLSSALAWGRSEATTYEDTSQGFRRVGETIRDGVASWLQAAATILDRGDLNLKVSAGWSDIDEDFRAHQAARPAGHQTLAGEHMALSSTLKAGGRSLVLTHDRLSTHHMDRGLWRARLGLDGLDVLLQEKSVDRFNIDESRYLREQSLTRSATLEIMPELLVPEWHAALGVWSAAVPSFLSLTQNRGEVTYPGGQPLDRIEGMEAVLTWSTRWGETTAFYWQESLGHQVDGMGFAGSSDTIFDVSHRITAGDWRFGAGVSMATLSHRDPAAGFDDDSLSGSLSVAYAPENGPSLTLAIGRYASRFDLDTEDYREARRNVSLSVSADLSPLINVEHVEGTTLTIDYRGTLSSVEAQALNSETGRQAFLGTFATRF